MKEVAPLDYGVIFKKAFCVPEIFTAFVQDLLDIRMKIDHVETEKVFSPPIRQVDIRFDLLLAEDRENRVVVNIQHIRPDLSGFYQGCSDHYDRFLYYHCAAMMEMVASSKEYRPKTRVFTIVVLTSGDRHKKDVGMTIFDPVDIDGHPYGEIPHKILHICPKYLNDRTPEPYREWMLAIEDSLDEVVDETTYSRPEILALFRRIEKNEITPTENAAMKDEYGQRLLIEKGREETAVNLIKMGALTEDQISQATGLPAEAIRRLQIDAGRR